MHVLGESYVVGASYISRDLHQMHQHQILMLHSRIRRHRASRWVCKVRRVRTETAQGDTSTALHTTENR